MNRLSVATRGGRLRCTQVDLSSSNDRPKALHDVAVSHRELQSPLESRALPARWSRDGRALALVQARRPGDPFVVGRALSVRPWLANRFEPHVRRGPGLTEDPDLVCWTREEAT